MMLFMAELGIFKILKLERHGKVNKDHLSDLGDQMKLIFVSRCGLTILHVLLFLKTTR